MDSADWKGMPLDSKFTNALMRQAILSIEEVMGAKGLQVVLREARGEDLFCRFVAGESAE